MVANEFTNNLLFVSLEQLRKSFYFLIYPCGRLAADQRFCCIFFTCEYFLKISNYLMARHGEIEFFIIVAVEEAQTRTYSKG